MGHARRIDRTAGSLRRASAANRSSAPVLFCLSFHGRRIRVLHFEPVGRAAGTIGGILALRGNAFEAELAGMGEDGRAVEIAPELTGHGLPLSKCEAYNRVYDLPIALRSSRRFSVVDAGRPLRRFTWSKRPSSRV